MKFKSKGDEGKHYHFNLNPPHKHQPIILGLAGLRMYLFNKLNSIRKKIERQRGDCLLDVY
jgi:hypothetical protein